MKSNLSGKMRKWRALRYLIIAILSQSALGPVKATESEISFGTRVKNATVLRDFISEPGQLRQFVVANGIVGMLLCEGSSSSAVVCDLGGALRFRHTSSATIPRQSGAGYYGGIGGIDLSEDGSTVVLWVTASSESFRAEVYAIDGTPLFRQEEPVPLDLSPHAQFFCTEFDEFAANRLAIFDRNGKMITWYENPSRWASKFFDDEKLVVVDIDSLRMIRPATGSVEIALPLDFEQVPLFHSRNIPKIAVSRINQAVAIYDERNLLVLSPKGQILRREKYDDLLCAATFDDSSPRILLQLRDWQRTHGYFLAVPLDKTQRIFRSSNIPELGRTYGPQESPALWISGGVVTYWRDASSSNSGAPLPLFQVLDTRVRPRTLFLTLDSLAGFLTGFTESPGFYFRTRRTGETEEYICASPPSQLRAITVGLKTSGARGDK